MSAEYDEEKDTFRRRSVPTNIFDYFKDKGLHFPSEILSRYVLSLHSKPFVILTGISGTGKTKIAQIFADYISQDLSEEERKKRVAFVSVRPDWMDNRGLLGYYNPLNEHYHATPVLRLLLNARAHPEHAYFIILDEMNLAKVEYYFADFLSILESRTNDKQEGEPLQLHELVEEVTTHGDKDLKIPAQLCIPPNVYFTGTVNVDETTYMFSPKVLDRAHVIEFNEIDLEGYAIGVTKSDKIRRFTLKDANVRDSLFSSVQTEPFCSKVDYLKVKKVKVNEKNLDFDPVQDLLNRLERYHLHFGYRVINELSCFLWVAANHVENFNADTTFDLGILQKVLPKFHGTRARLEKPLLNVLSFCYSKEAKIPDRDEEVKALISKAEQFDEKARFPRSAQKCARMLRTLVEQGYTSFIE
jgi:5-methylcytosine-specific restriction enzyme B